jgi:hypothetical protein
MLSFTLDHTWDGQPIPAARVVRVFIEADRLTSGLRIAVDSPFIGDRPPRGEPGPTWELWKSEVVEVFILGQDGEYLEIEMNPYGHWLAMRLKGARNIVDKDIPVRFRTAVIGGMNWTGRLTLGRDQLPPGPHRVNVAAIGGRGRHRKWLSWKPMPGDAPDFHQLEHFAEVTLP